ncbi:MAG TPA: tetratricopeptide repeat protein [Bryobacteraceae bacterium]
MPSGLAQETAQTVAEKAARQIQAGEFQAARSLLQKAVHDHPSDAELWNLLGITETELHDEDSAKKDFEQGLRLLPDSIDLHENLGFLYYRRADYVSAKKYLQRAVELGSKKPGVLFSLAASKLRTGNQAEAISELKSLEPALAGNAEYWEERGRADLTRDPAAAERSFERALDLAPRNLTSLNGAAAAAEKQGLDEKALSYLITARSAEPDDVATLIHFGSVCIRRDLGPDAIDALGRAHRLQPANNRALYLLARANITMENWQQAYDLFEQFAKRIPAFAATYYALGWLDIRLNRPDDARRQLEHCLSLAPGTQDARYELAQLELDDGHLDSAENLLRTVLQQQPEHAKANMTMGDLMMRRGKLPEAKTYLEAAIHSDPKLAAAHYKLSMLYFRDHDTEQAEKEKTLAADLNAEAKRASKTQLRLVLPEAEAAQ